MHQNSIDLFKKYALEYFEENMKVLEIGPNKIPSDYRKIVPEKNIEWDTIDIIKKKELTYISLDEYTFPIESNYYNIVLSGQVIEHVRKPWIWIKELSRVCKKGGFIITINPVSWPYHKEPYDCWRIYPEGMKALYNSAGIKLIFSLFTSLEAKNLKNKLGYRSILPGRSSPFELKLLKIYKQNNLKKWLNLLFSFKLGSYIFLIKLLKSYIRKIIRFPITCSYDTISIGIKK
jgi:SAM-dependent methyltransferase